jgi:hypothetical protein
LSLSAFRRHVDKKLMHGLTLRGSGGSAKERQTETKKEEEKEEEEEEEEEEQTNRGREEAPPEEKGRPRERTKMKKGLEKRLGAPEGEFGNGEEVFARLPEAS